ncbi:MAG: GNAT family N-acetyltransferase [Albidovulum sp.]|uniref:GNAT family N-acetyltransferase n=1 Tax=Albidovulum sp. TaxID=1872424 RepID=UPI003C96C745
MIPVLTGERVLLRGLDWADFEDFATLWGDPALKRFLPFAPVARDECWVRMNRIAWHWAHYGFGNFAVVAREDGAFLGQIGLFHVMRGIGEDFDAAPEAGWVLNAAARGRGLASEAAEIVHRWFDSQRFGGRTVCMMDVDHAGSIRVAEKCGYRLLRLDEDEWGPLQLMERVRG